MRRTLFYEEWNRCTRANTVRVLANLAIVVLSTGLFATTPDWLKQVAQAALPVYASDMDAVVLFDETVTDVSSSGEIHTTHRRAYKILRPQGRTRGVVHVYFDRDTRLTFLKAWSITSDRQEYEVKEGEAVETAAFSESLYEDTRYKSLVIPSAQPGNIVGYEYQQRGRPSVLQALWMFQDEIPIRRARFTLHLPPNWGFTQSWRNHTPFAPQQIGENGWTWELNDVDAIRSELHMPNWRSVAGELGVSFAPKDPASSERSFASWAQVARWYGSLAIDRREITPEIRDKTSELLRGINEPLEKIRTLASYVQHNIRYVGIEIGIGGYQPHRAAEVFTNRYGDCKDKATLLSAMLRDAGFDSYYVLINHERDFLSVDFPSMLNFDHMILAIRVPQQVSTGDVFAVLPHDKLGQLLFFDPTDGSTPVGYLPSSLQANYGLLVTGDGGELVKLPLLPSAVNRINRTARLNLDSAGKLTGTVEEIRAGSAATSLREELLSVPKIQRQKVFQTLLSRLLDGAALTSAKITDLEDFNSPLSMTYGFIADAYAQRPGSLFLFRSCALGQKGDDLLEDKPRQQPVVFSHTSSETDSIDVSYPAVYDIDELPEAVTYQYPFAVYRSELHAQGHTLHYSRSYELKTIQVPVQQLDDLKQFFRQIADDERAYTVLKPSAAAGQFAH